MATVHERKGTIANAQAATGDSDIVNADAWPTAAQLTFLIDENNNISAQLHQSIDGGATWVAVGSAVTGDGLTAITNPVGLYKWTTTVTAGSVTIKYQFGPFYGAGAQP
jgi:hypothetical protein